MTLNNYLTIVLAVTSKWELYRTFKFIVVRNVVIKISSQELATSRSQTEQQRMSSYEDIRHKEPAVTPRQSRPKSMLAGALDDETGIIRIERGGGPEREQRPQNARSPERASTVVPRQQVLFSIISMDLTGNCLIYNGKLLIAEEIKIKRNRIQFFVLHFCQYSGTVAVACRKRWCAGNTWSEKNSC